MNSNHFHLGFLIQTSHEAHVHFLSFSQTALLPFLSQLNPTLESQFHINQPLPQALTRKRDQSLSDTLNPFVEQMEFQLSSKLNSSHFLKNETQVTHLEPHVLLNQMTLKIGQNHYVQSKELFSFAVGRLHFALRECYLQTQHRQAKIPIDELSFNDQNLLFQSFQSLCTPKPKNQAISHPSQKRSLKP